MLESKNLVVFFDNVVAAVDFLEYKKWITFNNIVKNIELLVSNRELIEIDHVSSLPLLFSLQLNIKEKEDALHKSNWLSNYICYYDKNTEFENQKRKNPLNINLDFSKIFFEDSNENILIQFADNVVRLFNKYFKYKMFENKNDVAEKMFEKLKFQYIWKAALFMSDNDKNKLLFF